MLKDSNDLIKFLTEKNGESRYAYAEAFGFCWAMLSERAKKEILKHYSKKIEK